MTVKFNQIPVGARFEFRGRRYQKVALSMAHDEDRYGNVFLDYTEVIPEPGPVKADIPQFTRKSLKGAFSR